MTEAQIDAAIVRFALEQGREVNLTYDKGSYEVTTPTWLAKEFARAILKASEQSEATLPSTDGGTKP